MNYSPSKTQSLNGLVSFALKRSSPAAKVEARPPSVRARRATPCSVGTAGGRRAVGPVGSGVVVVALSVNK